MRHPPESHNCEQKRCLVGYGNTRQEHVGGRPQVSDVGSVNTMLKDIQLADPSEKKGVKRGMILNDFASEEDWCTKFREKAAIDTSGTGTVKG